MQPVTDLLQMRVFVEYFVWYFFSYESTKPKYPSEMHLDSDLQIIDFSSKTLDTVKCKTFKKWSRFCYCSPSPCFCPWEKVVLLYLLRSDVALWEWPRGPSLSLQPAWVSDFLPCASPRSLSYCGTCNPWLSTVTRPLSPQWICLMSKKCICCCLYLLIV